MGSPSANQKLLKFSVKIIVLFTCASLLTGMQGRTAEFESRVLASHNRERQALGLPTLHWDAGLARGAKAWADHLAANNKFEHSPNIPGQPLEGENIWGGTVDAFYPEDMVGLWLSEKSHFVKGVFPANSDTGRVEDVSHYTQIIWRRTGAVGCGISTQGSEEIMVCRYSAPGNRRGVDPLTS